MKKVHNDWVLQEPVGWSHTHAHTHKYPFSTIIMPVPKQRLAGDLRTSLRSGLLTLVLRLKIHSNLIQHLYTARREWYRQHLHLRRVFANVA